jgi:hypothetical protein
MLLQQLVTGEMAFSARRSWRDGVRVGNKSVSVVAVRSIDLDVRLSWLLACEVERVCGEVLQVLRCVIGR